MNFHNHQESLMGYKHILIRTDKENEKSGWLQKRIQDYYLKGYTVDVKYE